MTMTNVELVEAVLADMGAIHRRATNETLDEKDFRELMSRARWNAEALRQRMLDEEEPLIEVTDRAKAILAAGRIARAPGFRQLLSRTAAVMTGRDLVERGPSRLRTVTDGGRTLGVVDGDRM